MLKILFLILSVSIFIGAINGEIFNNDTKEISYRLPNNTYPENYRVLLNFGNFDEDEFTYTGAVTINITIIEETNLIVLHSAVVNVTSISFPRQNYIAEYEIDFDREFLNIKLADDKVWLKNETITLQINFINRIGIAFRGIYRGSYESDSETRYFLATHMQPTYARRVFPCYDEPNIKSFFNLALQHGNKFNSISNTDMINELQINPWVVKIFSETPLISTYLLGFVISDFGMYKRLQNDVTFRTFSRPDQIGNTNFGVDTAIEALQLFENRFNVKYNLNKLDQVALPQFNFGGMENHGIIFYREDSLLYEEYVSTVYRKEFTAATVVHEVCHMFLGNLLTYSWWSHLWLSEGFCRFFEYYMTHEIYPKMRLNELFAAEAMHYVLYIDSYPNTRPMTRQSVETPSEIASMFDSISYSKAASVIRMFYHALSEKEFTTAVHIYLTKATSNPKGVAEPKHFYEALNRSIIDSDSLDIFSAFESWEHQAGYPIILITRNYNSDVVKFTQKRFTDDIVANGSSYKELWHIPITYSSKLDRNISQFWLDERETELNIGGLRPSHYFIANINQTGYYRVLYDVSNWRAIANELNQSCCDIFSPNTRAMLIDDAGVFVETRLLDMSIFLELIKYLKDETDYIPWIAATNNLIYIRRMLNDGLSKLYNDFQNFLQILLENVFKTYGVTELYNEHYEKFIRNIAINWACQAHLPDCIKETSQILDKILTEKDYEISSDLKSTMMCNGAINATNVVYEKLWNEFERSSDKSERTLLLNTIGCIENEKILSEFIIKYNVTNDDEWFTLIQAVYLNGPIGMNVTLKFLKEEHKSFTTFIEENEQWSSLIPIFRGISNRINTNIMYDNFVKLMKMYEIPRDTISSLSLSVKENLKWIEKYSPIIQKFLDEYFKNDGNSSGSNMIFSIIVMSFAAIVHFFAMTRDCSWHSI